MDRQKGSSKDTASTWEPKASTKRKPARFSNTRLLTPTELEALKKDMEESLEYMKGCFKDLKDRT